MALKIREALESDFDIIYNFVCELENFNFERDVFQDIFKANVNNPDIEYYLAERDGEPLGFASIHYQKILHHNGLVGEIQELYVVPGARSSGLGGILVSWVVEKAKVRGVEQLEVCCNLKREEAQQFYEIKCGFDKTHSKFTMLLDESSLEPGEEPVNWIR